MKSYAYRLNDVKVTVYGNGAGIALEYPDGTSAWLQGDDAADLDDMLNDLDAAEAYSIVCEYHPE